MSKTNAENKTADDSRPVSVCLFGASLDVGNLGCRALAVSLIKLITEAFPNARITLMYGNREAKTHVVRLQERNVEVEVVNFRLSPQAMFKEHLIFILLMAIIYRCFPVAALRRRIEAGIPWIRALKKADLIGEIFGGDSFSDIYGLKRFIIGIIPSVIALLIGRRVVYLPQTYGPYSSGLSRFLARAILSRASSIYARDRNSIACLHDLFRGDTNKPDIRFCPDVAFLLNAFMGKPIVAEPTLDLEKKPLVGLNISGLLYMGGYTRDNMFNLKCNYRDFIHQLIERILGETDANILLIPHGFGQQAESDETACLNARKQLSDSARQRVHRLRGYYGPEEIKAIVGQCDFVIGSRMHACIAGISQGIPSVGLAYSRKFIGVFDSVGAGDLVLDMRELTHDALLDECLKRFKNRRRIEEALKAKVTEIQTELRSVFNDRILGHISPENKAQPLEKPHAVTARLG